MAQKNLNILVRLDLQMVKKTISGLRNGLNLLKSSLRAVFRTGIVAGFFAALKAGLGIVNSFKNTIKALGAEFLQLRLKATETAAIISRGGSGFKEAFQEAITMSREMATQMGFSAQQIQEGLVTAARSGLELNESLNLTGTAMKLATANGEQFQTTLNDLIGVSRAFGVELAELPVFADQLSAAVTESNVSLAGLFSGLKNVASVASVAFGETRQTIIDTTAALMTLNDAGIQGAKAGTRLRAAMQKLMGGTAKTTAAFTKYGVNLFQANATSQKYIGTLMTGQRAMASSEEKLNKLKNRQFELVIANKESTEEYKKLENELDAVGGKLSNLEKGLDNVYQQFTLAGGKLKPFSDVLGQIKGKVPTEVIGRAFGIRGGEAIMRLLKDLDKFKKFKDTIEEVTKESEKGISITDSMYKRFIDTVLIGWMRIKNTATAILGEIADGFFSAVQPFLAPIQDSLKYIFNSIKQNKGAFKTIFEVALAPLKTVMANMQVFASLFASSIGDVLTPGKTAKIPTLERDADTGILGVGTKEISGTVAEKGLAAFKTLGEAVSTLFKIALDKLKPAIDFLGKIFAEAVATALSLKTSIFIKIGTSIGVGLAAALTKAVKGMVKDTHLERFFKKKEPKRDLATAKTNIFKSVFDILTGKAKTPDSGKAKSVVSESPVDKALSALNTKKPQTQTKSVSVMAEIDGVLKNVDTSSMGNSVTSIANSMSKLGDVVLVLNKAQLKVAADINNVQSQVNSISRKITANNRK